MKLHSSPPKFVSPNLKPASEKSNTSLYDVVSLSKETYVTQKGKTVEILVFSRVSPEKIAENSDLSKSCEAAKDFVESRIKKLKCKDEKKEQIRGLLSAQIKGNREKSSEKFISADSFYDANLELFNFQEKKSGNSANTIIPVRDQQSLTPSRSSHAAPIAGIHRALGNLPPVPDELPALPRQRK